MFGVRKILTIIGLTTAGLALGTSAFSDATDETPVNPIEAQLTPAKGSVRANFTLSFTLGQALSSDLYYQIDAEAQTSKKNCVNWWQKTIDSGEQGKAVTLKLRPSGSDKNAVWCPGKYKGTIELLAPDYSAGGCAIPTKLLGTVASFSFTVKARSKKSSSAAVRVPPRASAAC